MGIDPTFGIAGGLVFIAIGVAYLVGGDSAGRIVAIVLVVPYVAWLGATVRKRRREESGR